MKHLTRTFAVAAATLLVAAPAHAQQRTQAGPVIHSAGAVFSVTPDLPTQMDAEYRVAFEVGPPASSPDRLNQSMNTVARFVNMHAQAGVPLENISGAMVVHGGASFELLDNDAYREKFGVDNPNAEMIRELIAAGMPVYLCGQSAASREVDTDRLIPGVEVALSAMTAFVLLQERGYKVNPW